MRVDAGISFHHYSPSVKGEAAGTKNTTSFSTALDGTASEKEKATNGKPDFTSMTRRELFDWMNGQIRSGDMSLDESGAFLGMTVKVSVATGQPVDMATDTTRIDFIEKARQGIEFLLSRFDYAGAERLQDALDMMLRSRGMDIRI